MLVHVRCCLFSLGLATVSKNCKSETAVCRLVRTRSSAHIVETVVGLLSDVR